MITHVDLCGENGFPNGVSSNQNEEVLSFSNGAFYSTKKF